MALKNKNWFGETVMSSVSDLLSASGSLEHSKWMIKSVNEYSVYKGLSRVMVKHPKLDRLRMALSVLGLRSHQNGEVYKSPNMVTPREICPARTMSFSRRTYHQQFVKLCI